MKKSRIIVPALAMLTLSVAASVTGTVAWFTASRTASMTASNLAAFNTEGNLTLNLAAGNQGNGSVTGTNIKLNKVRDFSYDVASGKGYTAILDSENNKVLGTKQVTDPAAKYATINSNDVYYMNTFTGTFSTNTSSNSYLIFSNNGAKSFVGNTGGESLAPLEVTSSLNTIYRALRVSMKTTHRTLVWAPYTTYSESNVMHVDKAGNFGGQTLPGIDQAPTKALYSTNGTDATTVISETQTDAVKVVKNGQSDPVNANTSNAAAEACVLSINLSSATPTQVAFSIWFEGLDPACIATSNGVFSIEQIGANITTALQMSFYAIDASAFPAQGK